MKRIGFFALAAMMITALSVSASAAGSFEAAAGTPVVDGKKDDAYVCDGIAIEIDETTGEKTTEGATGTAYAAWDDDYFYVYIEVKDSAVTPEDKVTGIWSDDSAEIYINLSGEEGAIADINAAQYTYGPSFTEFAGGGKHREANMADAKSAYTYTDDGWTIEVAIPWGADYTPKADASFTAAFGINDETDGDTSTREFHTFTSAGLNNAYSTADSNWDTMTLTTKKYEAPVEVTDETGDDTSAQTADMGIVMALASLTASGAAVLSLKKRK